MKILRLLLLVAFVLPWCSASGADAAPVVPATADEIAYWKKLQTEIIAYRAANGAYAATNFVQFSVAQLNEIMARTEAFLDARDGDAVEALGQDLQEYRQQLMAMLDNALTPLRLVAEGHSTKAGSANFNPQASMMAFARASGQFRTVDGYKGPLHRLHLAIDKRIVAGGGPRFVFFRTLKIGDSSDYEFAAATPAQRDEKFIAASAAVHPSLGAVAQHKFIPYRVAGRLDDEIIGQRDLFLSGVIDLTKQTATMTDEQLEQQLKDLPADAPADVRAQFEFVIALERTQRRDAIAYSVMLENWKAVFSQWLGKADDEALTEGCDDLAISPAGGWAASTADGLTVEARDLQTGAVRFTALSEFPIRGLTVGAGGELYAFTTGGTLRLTPPTAGTAAAFAPVNRVAYQTLVGAIDAAAGRERFVYAWGSAPAIADDGREMLFQANASSRITAVAMDDRGLNALVAYSGLNDSGGGKIRHGFDILTLPESSEELASKSVSSRSFNPAFSAPVNAIALTADAEHVVLTTGRSTFRTIELFHFKDPLKPDITQLALDNQPYTFVGFVGAGDALAVVAGTRQGIIRSWSAKTGELTARYLAPSGPQGIAMAIVGDDLITSSLGSPGLYRWSAADGRLLATLDGDAPQIEAEKLAAELKAEQARRPIIARFLAMRDTEDPAAKVAAARAFLAEDGAALEAAGLKDFVATTIINARVLELEALTDAKKFAEALQLGRQSLEEGLIDGNIYFSILVSARRVKAPDVDKLHDEARAAYPQSSDIIYLCTIHNQEKLSRAGNVDAALKEIDELDVLRPDANHLGMRQTVLFAAADRAYKAGNIQAAINHYVKSLDYCRSKDDQMNILPSIFSLAYEIKNWDLSARVAGAMLELDPNKKNDKQFMDAARYAYQMSQGGK